MAYKNEFAYRLNPFFVTFIRARWKTFDISN
jgi:hypothetical protein